MKYLLMGAVALITLTGCHTNNAGRPAEDTYMETGSNNRRLDNKTSDNIRDIGRQSSPSSPFTQGNGSLNF
jgi:hypothetical protein